MKTMTSKEKIAYGLIISSYLFGFCCIQLGFWSDLVHYTWFQILLCVSIIGWHHYPSKSVFKDLLIFFGFAWTIGYFIEVLGVNTGVIFGNYQYGDDLGFKILATPPMIGFNWFLLTYCVNDQVKRWQLSFIWHVLLAALLVVAIDIIIEPNAIKLGMWIWENDQVPLQNYIAWFAVSLLISAIYHRQIAFLNPYTRTILWCMILFFGLGLFV